MLAGADGFVNPNENLGVLSAGLGGTEAEAALIVVVAVGGLKVEVGFVVPGAEVSIT